MLIEEIKNIKSGNRELKKFGITIGAALLVLGLIFLWMEKSYYLYFLLFSPIFILSGLLFPSVLKPFQKVWMGLAVTIGWFVTRIILGVLFYLVVTPIGILFRLIGKDILDQKIDRNAVSYWIPKKDKVSKKEDYERQF